MTEVVGTTRCPICNDPVDLLVVDVTVAGERIGVKCVGPHETWTDQGAIECAGSHRRIDA